MCISAPYPGGETSPFHRISDKLKDSLFRNPKMTNEEIRKLLEQLASNPNEFLETVKRDLIYRKGLVNDQKNSEAMRNINERACKFYDRIITAFQG